LLKDEGYTNMKQLAGGMKAWNKEFKHLLENKNLLN
jgi:rhodanese-related sulfurtransferase